MTDPTHRVPRAEWDDHVCDYPPTCLCAPVVVEETLQDVPGGFVNELVVCHNSFEQGIEFPIQPEYQ